MAVSAERFDLRILHDNFKSALLEKGDVGLELYLKSYLELNKFFNLMGSIFGFVSSDLVSKIDILKELLAKDDENFKSVSSMIIYEKGNGLLNKSGYTSGSRTLLRLHRGLDFMRIFLQYVSELKDEDPTGSVCRIAYNETLYHHHAWYVATGAKLAMHSMPTKKDLFHKVCGDDKEFLKKSLEVLPLTLEVIGLVFDRIDNMYKDHDLHSLS